MSPTRADSNLDPSGEKEELLQKEKIRNLESSVSALQRIQAGSLSYKSAPGQAAATDIVTKTIKSERTRRT